MLERYKAKLWENIQHYSATKGVGVNAYGNSRAIYFLFIFHVFFMNEIFHGLGGGEQSWECYWN